MDSNFRKNISAAISQLALSSVFFSMGFSLLGCARHQDPDGPGKGESITPSQDVYGGGRWLLWDQEARQAFILGNLQGFADGQATGCLDAEREFESSKNTNSTPKQSEERISRCASKLPSSRRSVPSYEKTITDFYTNYPNEKSILAQDLVRVLVYDSEGAMTASDLRKTIKTRTVHP